MLAHHSSVSLKINEIYGLNKIDTIVFAEACNFIMTQTDSHVNLTDIEELLKKKNISDEDIAESLDILDTNDYIKATRVMCKPEIQFFMITTYGFSEFLEVNVDDYSLMIDNISLKIINESLLENLKIQKVTNYPIILVNHVLKLLSDRGSVKITECIGGEIFIGDVSSEFKRQYR